MHLFSHTHTSSLPVDATHYVGKWHAGFSDPSATPSARGFDTSCGFFMKAHHHFSHCSYLGYEFALKQHTSCRSAPSNRSIPLLDYFEGTASTGDIALGAASPLVANRTYSTHLFARKAVGIIQSHEARPANPLFLLLSLSATHKPFLAPAGLAQRAALAHHGRYFHQCAWTAGSPAKCRSQHRKGYEAMAVGVDDLVGELRAALTVKDMWDHTLMIFASDNGGPIGPQESGLPRLQLMSSSHPHGPTHTQVSLSHSPTLPIPNVSQASNLPLRGGKDSNLEGGVRTLAALGGGWLPSSVRGLSSHAFMHESDWFVTLAHVAGAPSSADERAAALGLPPVDGFNLFPSWRALAEARLPTTSPARSSIGAPRTLVLATRFGLPGTPYGGTSALIDVQSSSSAFKLIRGVVCECPECRPCMHCNASGGGCVFDVMSDPSERHDLAGERPELLAALNAKLDVAVATKFIDLDPVNQECWQYPKDDPDHWMEVALARNAVMQPWLKTPARRGAKPRMLYPSLKRGKVKG